MFSLLTLFSGHIKIKNLFCGASLLIVPQICSPLPGKARLGSLLTMKFVALNTGFTPHVPRRDINVFNFKVDIFNDQNFRKQYFAKLETTKTVEPLQCSLGRSAQKHKAGSRCGGTYL